MICTINTQSWQLGDDGRQANEDATKRDHEERTPSSQETAPTSELQASKRGQKSAGITPYDVVEGPTTTMSDAPPLSSLPPLL